MSRALIIGDPHFKVSNTRETDLMVSAIIKEAIQRNPDFIVVLGDVLDRHETIHVSPQTRAVNFLVQLMEIAPTYVLIGNHDLKNNRQFLSDEHPFVALKYWNPLRITIVDKVVIKNINDQKFVFVPYVPPGRFEEALNTNSESWDDATCIFAHQEFKGAQMGAIISIEGDDWPKNYPLVFTGHIHDYQELQNNIIYTGTPIQHAFGDRHDKTISYVTFHNTHDEQSNAKFHQVRIDLGVPRKEIVRLNCSDVATYVPDEGKELKIIIRGSSGEIKAIMKHPNIDAWKKQGYKIAYKDIPLDRIAGTTNSDYKFYHTRYSALFFDAIKNNQKLGNLYNQLFGAVKITDQLLTSQPTHSTSKSQIINFTVPSQQTNSSLTNIEQQLSSLQLSQNVTSVKPRLTLSLNIKK